MQDEFQEANKVGLYSFLDEHYSIIRAALLFLCDRIEKGFITKVFPQGVIATKIKPAIPKIRELIERLDKIIHTAD